MSEGVRLAMTGQSNRSKLRKSALCGRIVERVRERVIRWEYPPGYRFTEDDLCREFGVSRSPVREALRILTANGFVELLPHRGYRVRQLDIADIKELYEVRLALELLVAERLAGAGMAAIELDRLTATWEEVLRTPGRSHEDLAALDEAFHETLAQAHGNGALLRQLRAINERLFIFRTIDFASAERVASTCHQHLAILDRIRGRDPAGARAAVQRNVEDGCTIVEAAIGSALAKSYSGLSAREAVSRVG